MGHFLNLEVKYNFMTGLFFTTELTIGGNQEIITLTYFTN